MACKHFLRSLHRHPRKDRSPTGQSHIGRLRQVENVIAVQEQPEHVGTANDTDAASGAPSAAKACSNEAPAGFQNSAFSFDGSAAMVGITRVRINRRRKSEPCCPS